MDLLEKFDAVKIMPNARIPEADRLFCETHQRAYETARSCFTEMLYMWDDILSVQKEILSEVETDSGRLHAYLPKSGSFDISSDAFHKHITSLHHSFIQNVVVHFNKKYHMTLDSSTVSESLLPREPDIKHGNWKQEKEAIEEYQDKLESLILRYEDIIDLLFVQLNGHTFQEQAIFELKNKCHGAVWSSSQNPEFELKKDTLRLTSFACSYSNWYSSRPWELSEGTKNVLRGIAHYETGTFSIYPQSLSDLLAEYRIDNDVIPFSGCEKVKQLKMFKNRRVDIKFTTAGYASQFVSEYLGLVY